MGTNVTKAQFIENVRHFTGITSNTAAATIADQVIEAIVCSAGQGTLTLRGFGTYKTILAKARKARNPRTGETVMVPAREKLTFKPSKLLQED